MKTYEVKNPRITFSDGTRLHEGDTLTEEELEHLVEYKYARNTLIDQGDLVVLDEGDEEEPELEPDEEPEDTFDTEDDAAPAGESENE